MNKKSKTAKSRNIKQKTVDIQENKTKKHRAPHTPQPLLAITHVVFRKQNL